MLGATSAAIGCPAFQAGTRDLVPRTAAVTRPLNSQWCGSWKCQPHVPRILTCVAKLKPFCRGASAFGRGLRVEIPSLGSERQRQASFHRTACGSQRGWDSHAKNRKVSLCWRPRGFSTLDDLLPNGAGGDVRGYAVHPYSEGQDGRGDGCALYLPPALPVLLDANSTSVNFGPAA